MLTELIIFAVVLVTLNLLMGVLVTVGLLKLCTNKKFIVWYYKKFFNVMKEVNEMIEDLDEE